MSDTYPPKNRELVKEARLYGKSSFRMEVYVTYPTAKLSECTGEQIWLLTNRKPQQRILLPSLPIEEGYERAEIPFPVGRVAVSSDEHVLIADRKICSGSNSVHIFLSRNHKSYELINEKSINERIIATFVGYTNTKFLRGKDRADFVLFEGWLKKSDIAIFACGFGGRNRMTWYRVFFNAKKNRFYHFHCVDVKELNLFWQVGLNPKRDPCWQPFTSLRG